METDLDFPEYPLNDIKSLEQNIFHLFHNGLVIEPLQAKCHVLSKDYPTLVLKEAMLQKLDVNYQLGLSLVNRLKIKVIDK